MAKRRLEVLPGGQTEPFDPWKFTDDKGYSPEKFYMQSKNTHDHAEQIHLRLPPDQLAQIDAAVGSEQLPYQSRQDMIRDAVVHRNHWITEQKIITDPEWREWVAIQEFLGRTEAQERQEQARDLIVERARVSLQAAVQRGDREGFQQSLTRVREASVSVAEPWATTLREILKQYEGHKWA